MTDFEHEHEHEQERGEAYFRNRLELEPSFCKGGTPCSASKPTGRNGVRNELEIGDKIPKGLFSGGWVGRAQNRRRMNRNQRFRMGNGGHPAASALQDREIFSKHGADCGRSEANHHFRFQ